MPLTVQSLDAASQLERYVSMSFTRVMRNRYRGNSVIRRCLFTDGIGEKGVQMSIPIDSAVSSVLRTPGQPYAGNSDTGGSVPINIDKERHVPVFGVDVAVGAMKGITRQQEQMESNINTMFNDLEKEFVGLVTAAAGFTAGSYGTAPTEENIAALVALLLQQENVPPGNMIGILSPTAWTKLAQVPNFANALGANAARRASAEDYGEGTYFHNTIWSQSQAIPQGAAPGNYDNLIMFPQAAVVGTRCPAKPMSNAVVSSEIVDQQTGMSFQILIDWDPVTKSDCFTVRMLYGFSVLYANWIGKLKS